MIEHFVLLPQEEVDDRYGRVMPLPIKKVLVHLLLREKLCGR